MKTRSYYGWWIVALLLALASGATAYLRLDGVPDVSADIGPDLVIRAAEPADTHESGFQIARGDRISAMGGHAIETLPELREIVRTVTRASNAEVAQAEYQAIRPLHRFTLVLRGQELDGGQLPVGIEPTDDLVEVDGRVLPGRVGPEGLKSIMASRPEAVLGFERRNALFSGKIWLYHGPKQKTSLGLFGLAFLLTLVLLRFRSSKLDPRLPASVALETVMLAWVALLLIRFQWVIADPLLTTITIVAFALIRPVAFLGRSLDKDDGASAGTMMSLVLATLASLGVGVLLFQGIVTTERALQFGAVTGFFYIVYELVAGFARASGASGQERSIYLVGVIALVVAAACYGYLSNPEGFLENGWAPYAAVVLALIWFSDFILCIRGPAISSLDEVSTSDGRRQKIQEYFETIREHLEDSSFRLLLYQQSRSVSLGEGLMGFEINEVDSALHDAMAILIEEGARIPLLDSTDSHTHPMSGIARTMKISLALRREAPEGAAVIPNVSLVVLGFGKAKGQEELPIASIEALSVAHDALNAIVWTAAMLEGLPHLASESAGPAAPSISPDMVDQLETSITELNAEIEDLRQSRGAREVDLGVLTTQMSLEFGSVKSAEALVEPELLEGLEYLVESEEPIVISGPCGAGKRFTAWLAHQRDTDHPGPLLFLDVANWVSDSRMPDLDGVSPDLYKVAAGGALLVRSAQLLTAQQLKALIHRSKDAFRLYLCFDESDPEGRSPLEAYPDLASVLEERELVLPPFRKRRAIQSAVFHHFAREASRRRRKELLGISSSAMDFLQSYDFSGNLTECKAMVDAAVERTGSEVLDLEDFA